MKVVADAIRSGAKLEIAMELISEVLNESNILAHRQLVGTESNPLDENGLDEIARRLRSHIREMRQRISKEISRQQHIEKEARND